MEGTTPITHIRLLYDNDESDSEDGQLSDTDDGMYVVCKLLNLFYRFLCIGPQPIYDGKIHYFFILY